MAAVVRKTKGNRYHTHRIMLPSGAVLAFTETKNAEATPALSSGNTEEQYTPITSASGDIVAQSKKKSNTSKQKNSDRDTEYLEIAKDPEKNAARLQEMVDEAAKRAMKNTKILDEDGNLLNKEQFSMREPVETTDRLIAWHNMSEDALRSSL